MVTVIAARPNQSGKCTLITFSESIGTTSRTEFDVTDRSGIKPGEPKWANYVKGPIANFTCWYRFEYLSICIACNVDTVVKLQAKDKKKKMYRDCDNFYDRLKKEINLHLL